MADQESIYQEAMNKGHSEAWDQRWEKAAEYYRQAVQAKPNDAQAINNMGLALFELEKYDEAEICYQQAAKVSPDEPLPIEKLATIYEKVGKIQQSIEQSMAASDLWLKHRDADKAIENWARVTRLQPDNLRAHSRLAVVYERLGRKPQAVREFIAMAALLQDVGQIEEAIKAVGRAVAVDPESEEALQAQELVRANKTLPKPRPQVSPVDMPKKAGPPRDLPPEALRLGEETPEPIAEARQAALTQLAGLLFDVSTDEVDETLPRGLAGVIRGNSGAEDLDFSMISLHLGMAIDYQTRAQDEKAAEELKKAVDAGLNSPAAFFNLGLLYHRLERMESGVRNLQRAMNHPDFALAARLLIGDYYLERGEFNEAAMEYLEALKTADLSVVFPEQVETLRQQYEPIIEAHSQETDEETLKQLINNIDELLKRPNWRQGVAQARQQLPSALTGSLATPLAEILTQAESTEMVQAIAHINELARKGYYRSAMEEAYTQMNTSATYLPMHIHMAELLLRQGRTQDAIAKFKIVAETYSCRGEPKRATDLLQRIVQIAPLDQMARRRLIDRFVEQGRVDDAIQEYIELADVNYRLAQLDIARSTYENALRLVQQANADRSWSVRILHHMADIDMQRLDWRQALRVYEQLRTLGPDDKVARQQLIGLNIRLGQQNQSSTELDNYLSYLEGSAKDKVALEFLEELVTENQEIAFVRRRLAEYYQQAARVEDAIAQWDVVAKLMVDKGDNERAKEAIRAILVLNPPNADQYRAVLQKLG